VGTEAAGAKADVMGCGWARWVVKKRALQQQKKGASK
jgi:hypothetical protein